VLVGQEMICLNALCDGGGGFLVLQDKVRYETSKPFQALKDLEKSGVVVKEGG